jgi:hypothetical protein
VSEGVHFLLNKAWKFEVPRLSDTEKLSEKQTIKMVSLLCQHARQIKPPFCFFSKNAKNQQKLRF